MVELRHISLKTFPTIPESAAPHSALSICGLHGLGVVVDEQQSPTALVTRKDLIAANERGAASLADPCAALPPSVLAEEMARLEDLFSFNIFPAFAVGARGAIVVSPQRRAVGVLALDEMLRHLTDKETSTPATRRLFKAFTDYLFSREAFLRIDLLSGVLPLFGTSRRVEILIRCPECGCLNRLAYLDPSALPQCQQPEKPRHRLSLPPVARPSLPED